MQKTAVCWLRAPALGRRPAPLAAVTSPHAPEPPLLCSGEQGVSYSSLDKRPYSSNEEGGQIKGVPAESESAEGEQERGARAAGRALCHGLRAAPRTQGSPHGEPLCRQDGRDRHQPTRPARMQGGGGGCNDQAVIAAGMGEGSGAGPGAGHAVRRGRPAKRGPAGAWGRASAHLEGQHLLPREPAGTGSGRVWRGMSSSEGHMHVGAPRRRPSPTTPSPQRPPHTSGRSLRPKWP